MAKRFIKSKYNREDWPDKVYEVNEGPVIVDVAGYVDTKTQIERMMLAGELLITQRREAYYDAQSGDDLDALELDPTRSGSYDLADAHNALVEQKARLEEAKRQRERAYKVDPTNDEAIVDERKNVNVVSEVKEEAPEGA